MFGKKSLPSTSLAASFNSLLPTCSLSLCCTGLSLPEACSLFSSRVSQRARLRVYKSGSAEEEKDKRLSRSSTQACGKDWGGERSEAEWGRERDGRWPPTRVTPRRAHLDGDHLVELQCPLLVEPDEAADAVVVRAVDTHLRHKHTTSGLWVRAPVFQWMSDGCAS